MVFTTSGSTLGQTDGQTDVNGRHRIRSIVHSVKRSRPRTVPLLAIAVGWILALSVQTAIDFDRSPFLTLTDQAAIAQKPAPDFPLKPHPLPPTLAQWHDAKQTGDYFDQVKPVPVGYLVWTHVPVTVYVQPSTQEELANPFRARRSQAWITAVTQAVQEWSPYLPLKIVAEPDGVDIAVWRTPPPIQLDAEDSPPSTAPAPTVPTPTAPPPADGSGQPLRQPHPRLQTGRVRSAVTRYQIYAQGLPNAASAPSRPVLAQRFTIQLRPDQAPDYLQAAARHELGHALGIWGHSQSPTDVMYFSQVRHPPPISPRDLNTLKRVYEQPTRLGWPLSD